MTFLALTVRLAARRGFWVAMDLMRRGEKEAEFSVIALHPQSVLAAIVSLARSWELNVVRSGWNVQVWMN